MDNKLVQLVLSILVIVGIAGGLYFGYQTISKDENSSVEKEETNESSSESAGDKADNPSFTIKSTEGDFRFEYLEDYSAEMQGDDGHDDLPEYALVSKENQNENEDVQWASSVNVVVLNKSDSLKQFEGNPEWMTDEQALVMNNTAMQGVVLDKPEQYEEVEFNGRTVIKAETYEDYISEGVDSEGNPIDEAGSKIRVLAYGTSIDEDYFAVVYISILDDTEGVDYDLLETIIGTIEKV